MIIVVSRITLNHHFFDFSGHLFRYFVTLCGSFRNTAGVGFFFSSTVGILAVSDRTPFVAPLRNACAAAAEFAVTRETPTRTLSPTPPPPHAVPNSLRSSRARASFADYDAGGARSGPVVVRQRPEGSSRRIYKCIININA